MPICQEVFFSSVQMLFAMKGGWGCFLKGKLYESLRESCGKVSAAMLWVADAILRVVVGGITPWGTIDGSESNKIVSASIFDCI